MLSREEMKPGYIDGGGKLVFRANPFNSLDTDPQGGEGWHGAGPYVFARIPRVWDKHAADRPPPPPFPLGIAAGFRERVCI